MSAPQRDLPKQPVLEEARRDAALDDPALGDPAGEEAGARRGTLFPIVAGVVLLAGALLLSFGVLSGGGGGGPAGGGGPGFGGAPGGPAQVVPVRLATVEKGELSRERRLPGEIVAERRAALHAEVGGQVNTLPKRLGEPVKQGELLVTLDAGALPAEVRRAEASAEVARARADRARIVLEQRQRDVERRVGLAKEGAVSASELDATRTELKTAEVDLALAEAEARRADAETEALRVRLAQTRVRAPFDGTIAAVHVDPGTIVSAGRLLVEVVSQGAPLVRFSIGEGDAAALERGEKVRLKTALAEHEAEVIRIGSAVDPESRTLPVEARLLVPEGQAVPPDALPGMFVEVSLEANAPPESLVVPLTALAGKGAQRTAFVDDGGVARARAVRVLLDDGKHAAVSGLSAGERVVVVGADTLRDGQKIEAVE